MVVMGVEPFQLSIIESFVAAVNRQFEPVQNVSPRKPARMIGGGAKRRLIMKGEITHQRSPAIQHRSWILR
jgi:hypothetical protein